MFCIAMLTAMLNVDCCYAIAMHDLDREKRFSSEIESIEHAIRKAQIEHSTADLFHIDDDIFKYFS